MTKRIKTGGRTKGTLNKINSETKHLINEALKKEFKDLDSLLFLATPKQRLDFYIKLLSFVSPKQKANIEVNGDVTDYEITVNNKRASIFTLFGQEDRIKRLEKFFDESRR